MAVLQRVRMSYDEWLALPEKPKTEWVDGEVVMGPPPVWLHGFAQGRIGMVLMAAFPDLFVTPETAVRLPRNRIRLPDLTVVDHPPSGGMVVDAPVLVVEVLSPSTRSEDTVRKSGEYAAAGIGQYWIADPDLHALDVYELVDGGWEPLLHLDDAHPIGSVIVGEHGTVTLDVTSLFR